MFSDEGKANFKKLTREYHGLLTNVRLWNQASDDVL